MVVWEFTKVSATALCQSSEAASDITCSDEEASGDDREHTLPFKVLGVTFKHRQMRLEAASKELENGEEVRVDIQPEPDNDHNIDAIAVLLNYGSGWHQLDKLPKN